MKDPHIFEEKVGFDEVRKELLKLCTGTDSRELSGKIGFSKDFTTIKNRLDETAEALKSLQTIRPQWQIPFSPLPLSSVKGISLKLPIPDMVLTADEFTALSKALKNAREIYSFFHLNEDIDAGAEYPRIKKLTESISDGTPVINLIDRVFDAEGNIKDNASKELAEIRANLRQLSGSASSVIRRVLARAVSEGYLAENTSPVVRDGRLVLPVEAMNKRNIRGIIHDESATGRTFYIEPSEVVEVNNRLRELEAEEEREIVRILSELTANVRAYSDTVKSTGEVLIYLDFVHAKALLANRTGGQKPQLSKKPELEWFHAINPNLASSLKEHKREVVPLNITLTQEKRILVISGPNAGGKSVTLKTVGLLQYMLQCGLLPPMYSNSRAGVFDDIFIDIGDNQSIENELSTYSSHIRNMKDLLRSSGPRALFLIDEFGSGTEPLIGGAIAESILLELNARKAWGIITTHYQNLKEAAEQNKGLVNGSMLYDRHKMEPLYTLSIGNAGSSFALEIARKAGLPTSIIDKATEIVGQEYVDSDKYLLDINRDRKYWEQKRYDIKVKEKKLDKLIEQWEEANSELKEKRKNILEEARGAAQKLLKDTNATIEHTIKEIRENEAEKSKTKELRSQLASFRESLEKEYLEDNKLKTPFKPSKRKKRGNQPETSETDISFKVGDIVKISGNNVSGEIIEIKGDNAVVNFGLTKTTISIDRLQHSKEKRSQTVKIASTLSSDAADSQRERRNNFRLNIDVRGMRVDEALQAITYYIDDAIQYEAPSVKILHGTGTGALRQSIRQLLASYGKSLTYHDEDVRLGGAGITVVDLKK